MTRARKKGMTNGDYVYIMSTLSDVQDQGTDYWLQGKGGIVDKNESKKALQSVLALVPKPFNLTKYNEFKRRLIQFNEAKDVNYTLESVSIESL